MRRDYVKAKGSLQIKKYNANWNLVETREIPNMVMTLGKNFIASRMASNSASLMSHMAIGDQNTAPIATETTLGNELGRVALDIPGVATNNSVLYSATFLAGTGTGSLTEAGIFDDSANGTMICRSRFNEIEKLSSDAIVITWTIEIQ